MPALTESRRRQRENELLDAVEEALVATGTVGSVRELARAAGVTTGSAYAHFATKEGLVVAAIERVLDRHFRLSEVRGGLVAISHSVLTSWSSDDRAARLSLAVWNLMQQDAAVRETADRHLVRYREDLAEALRSAMMHDGLAPELADDRRYLAADAMIGFAQGIAVQQVTLPQVNMAAMVDFAAQSMGGWADR